jgi:uncharacterized membrane protein
LSVNKAFFLFKGVIEMQIALFSLDGLLFVLRWLHFVFGVTWIGLLYYFNFVQGAFFAETDAATKSGAIQKLVPRALWWFRYAALYTVVTGILYLGLKGHLAGSFEIFASSWGINITIGMVLGLIMASNVWFIIWPNQKIVIQSATQAASGGQALPNAAAAGAKAGLASRTNTLFSIPLLFFMGAASHLPIAIGPNANFMVLGIVMAVIIGAIELNAIKGKTGPITSIKGVIHCGFALALVMYFAMEFLTK